jgi:hypothetical protein
VRHHRGRACISAADIGADAFAAGARQRRDELEAAREALRAQRTRQPALLGGRGGADVWETLGGYERNTLLDSLLRVVIVARAGAAAPAAARRALPRARVRRRH